MTDTTKRYRGRIKSIIGYEGLYEAHGNGLIWSVLSGKYIGSVNKRGYKLSVLVKNGVKTSFPAHRLIALYFVKNSLNKPYVNHINGIKDDNRPVNLEWCTAKENCQHAFRTGIKVIAKGSKNPMYGRYGFNSNKGKPVNQIDLVTKKVLHTWGSASDAARNLGISRSNITALCRNQNVKSTKFIFQYQNK